MTTLHLGKSIARSPCWRGYLLIAVALACFGLLLAQKAFGVTPDPDGGYPGGNTANGYNALVSNTTGVDNTATGFGALIVNTTANANNVPEHAGDYTYGSDSPLVPDFPDYPKNFPGVQLLPLQFAQVAASNVSTGSVSTTINILNADGSVFMTRTSQVAANQTFVFRFQNGGTTSVYSAVVTSSAASSIVSDLQVLLPNNEVGVVFQPVVVPNDGGSLYTPSARLIPGQAALATVTNITSATTQFSLTVLETNGNTVISESGSLNPGQTLSYPFSNMGTANNTYRSVVSTGGVNTVTANVLLFEKTTGQIRAILGSLNPQPLPPGKIY